MAQRLVEAEGDTLDVARENMKRDLPTGWVLLTEQVLQRGGKGTVRGFGRTLSEAEGDAERQVPPGARIVSKEGTPLAAGRILRLPCANRDAAMASAQEGLSEGEAIADIRLSLPGRNGFFGMGRSLPTFEVTTQRLAFVDVEYATKAKVRCKVASYPSLGERLMARMEAGVPKGWVAFRSQELLFELWYPHDWVEASVRGSLLLRAPFSTTASGVFSPGVSVHSWTDSSGRTREPNQWYDEGLSACAKGFQDMRVISDERIVLRAYAVACVRFLFAQKQVGETWEASALFLASAHDLFVVDASGTVEDMDRHAEILEGVIASFRRFNSWEAYQAARSQVTQTELVDAAPEGRTVGVLFSLADVDHALYGRVIQDEVFRIVDGRRLTGTVISVGDVLPASQFFCVKFETPDASTAEYVRRVFGESSTAKALAPVEGRFISGGPLERLALVRKGRMSQGGEYEGGPWY